MEFIIVLFIALLVIFMDIGVHKIIDWCFVLFYFFFLLFLYFKNFLSEVLKWEICVLLQTMDTQCIVRK